VIGDGSEGGERKSIVMSVTVSIQATDVVDVDGIGDSGENTYTTPYRDESDDRSLAYWSVVSKARP